MATRTSQDDVARERKTRQKPNDEATAQRPENTTAAPYDDAEVTDESSPAAPTSSSRPSTGPKRSARGQ